MLFLSPLRYFDTHEKGIPPRPKSTAKSNYSDHEEKEPSLEHLGRIHKTFMLALMI